MPTTNKKVARKITKKPVRTGPGEITSVKQRLTVLQRCALVASDVDYIQKDGKVTVKTKAGGTFAYAAVTHDAVTSALRGVMITHGLMPKVNVTRHEFHSDTRITMLEVVLTIMCVDDKTDSISHTVWGYGQDFGDKGPGKALSYAVKNAYLKAFMLESGEDDEARVPNPGSGPITEADLIELQDAMDATDSAEGDILKYISDSQGLDIPKLAHLPKRFLPMISALLAKKKKNMETED